MAHIEACVGIWSLEISPLVELPRKMDGKSAISVMQQE